MISFRRFYHVSAVVYSVSKQGKKLCKMINPRSKKQWYPSYKTENDLLPSVKSLSKLKYEPGKRGIRRMAMLNKLFMKSITDIMSTGTVAMDVVGHGIEISKVSVTPDMQAVNVFWVCKGTSNDEQIEAVLNKAAGPLRHELSTLRVMGEVPYIIFLKDKQESVVADLDRCLAEADYGEDYVRTEIGHLIKTEFTLHTKLSPEMKAKIKQLEDELPIIDEPIPEMTHNIYGLDHARIMSRLLASRKKSKEAWSNLENETDNVISYRTPQFKSPEPDVIDQRQELADFLIKRQILNNKLNKMSIRNDWKLDDNDDDDDFVDALDEDDEEDDYYDDDYDSLNFRPNDSQRPEV